MLYIFKNLKIKYLTKITAIISRDRIIVVIFVSVDDFCKEFAPFQELKLIGKPKIPNHVEKQLFQR